MDSVEEAAEKTLALMFDHVGASSKPYVCFNVVELVHIA
jgi:hypothetical protein